MLEPGRRMCRPKIEKVPTVIDQVLEDNSVQLCIGDFEKDSLIT